MDNNVIRWGFLILIIGGIAGGIYFYVQGQVSNAAQVEKLQQNLPEFLAATGTGTEDNQPYIRGRVVPIDAGMKDIDDKLFKVLPSELRPTKPEQVGTVVWLKFGYQKVESNLSNVPASVQTCEVTIVDKAQNRVVAKKLFVGEHPTQVAVGLPKNPNDRAGYASIGPAPYASIAAYLASLPRQ